VVRGGFGISHEQHIGVSFLCCTTYPDQISFILFQEASFNTFPRVPQSGPETPPLLPAFQSFTNPSPDYRNATTNFYSLSVQRELCTGCVLEAGYIGNRSYGLPYVNELNPLVGGVRLNPAWSSRMRLESPGIGNYNAGYARFDRRAGRLLVGVNYAWSAALDLGAGNPQDSRDVRRDYGRAAVDRPHRVSAHALWAIPGPAGGLRTMRRVLGGWTLAGYGEWQSGEPFSVITGVDTNGDGVVPDRPDYRPDGALTLDPVTGNWRSFRTPLDGSGRFVAPLSPQGVPAIGSMPRGGNLGRNTFRGPAYANTNLTALKSFTLREQVRAELRASWTNLLNRRNFGPPVAVMADPAFGTNQSNPVSRETMLSLKIRF
jgi:hypothetical protein